MDPDVTAWICRPIWIHAGRKYTRAESLSTTARGSAVTTVTNSLSAAHSSPGLVLIADPFPSSPLTCIDSSGSVTRPQQFLPATTSSPSVHRQPTVNIYERPKPTLHQVQSIEHAGEGLRSPPGTPPAGDTTIKSQPLRVPRSTHGGNLIRQLLLRNLNAQKLLQLKLQQQQQQISEQKQLVPQTRPISGQQQVITQKQDNRELSSPQNIVQLELPSQRDISKLQQQENIRKQFLLLQNTLAARQHQKTLQQQQQQLTRQFTTLSQGGTNQQLNSVQFRNSDLHLLKASTEQKCVTSEGGVEVLLPMTGGKIEARDRPKETTETMESRFNVELQPFISTCGELPLSTDFIDASIYASSPNSLHIYEQEKIDMQCTMGASTSCTSLDAVSTGDDFDLKAQYEVSQDISSFPLADISSSTSQTAVSSIMDNTGESSAWSENLKPVNQDVYIKTDLQDVSTPTLAELNMNVDLLDDIESYINFEMNVGAGPSAPCLETVIKQEPGHMLEKERSFDLMGQAGGSGTRMSSATSVQLMPILASSTIVKTEPVEMRESCRNEFQKSFTQMTAVKPELIVPHAVTEAKAPLSTIKEIDISDFTTLQRLLKTEPLQARVGRKRTVSESQTSIKPVSRKRSVGSAGLDSMELKWEEIKQFLHTETLNIAEPPAVPTVKRERTRYDSTSSVMTLTSNEDDDSDSDKDFDEDSDSDLEGGHDIGSLSPSESLIGTKEKQYFWQYNVQSKGPKGTRVKFELEEDPHVLNDFEDPVFGSTNTENLSGIGVSIKHGGKARKGDGNDIVPSPKRLCQIGLQLRKINKQINDFVPVSELPSQARSKSRKEKNKLASRACRLKKKAQHEANKIKLHGLETEHRHLLTVIHLIRQRLYERLKKMPTDDKRSMSEILETLIKEHLGEMIAGHTTDFVNSVIHKVEAGDLLGGILVHATRSYPKELHN